MLDSSILESFRLRGTFHPIRVAMKDLDVTLSRWGPEALSEQHLHNRAQYEKAVTRLGHDAACSPPAR